MSTIYRSKKACLAAIALVTTAMHAGPSALAASSGTAVPALSSPSFGWSKAADDFQPPLSGPGPVTFEKAHPYIPNNDAGKQVTVRIADLTNPILKPWAVERMRKANEDAASGKEAYEARASCHPGGVPGLADESVEFGREPVFHGADCLRTRRHAATPARTAFSA